MRDTGFLHRSITVAGENYPYQVYVPADFTPSRRWPVILFLHGAGEGGEDGLLPTEVGVGTAIRRAAHRFPAIVVFPQARRGRSWRDTMAVVALRALDRAVAEFQGDPRRLYLTGLSMGGSATLRIAADNPGRFAALAPVCAGLGDELPRAQDGGAPEPALAGDLPASATRPTPPGGGTLTTRGAWTTRFGPTQGRPDLAPDPAARREAAATIPPLAPPIIAPPAISRATSTPATASHPAAATPIERLATALGQTPVWVFQGADDPAPTAAETRRLVAALDRVSGRVRYTEYPGVGHNAWDRAYADPGLTPWLLSHRRDG